MHKDIRLEQRLAYERMDPASVVLNAKLTPLFDRFDPAMFCVPPYDAEYLCCPSRSMDSDWHCGSFYDSVQGHSGSFYDSIRQALTQGNVASEPAEAMVAPDTLSKAAQSASAWSAGASGDGIMFEQSLTDALQTVLPADALTSYDPELSLLRRNLPETLAEEIEGASASQDTTGLASTELSENHRPLPLHVCATFVQDGRTAGALARAAEVFGGSGLYLREAGVVKGGSFIATSVGAGQWLPIEAVVDGQLQEWLDEKRVGGYTIVAVEPSSAVPGAVESCKARSVPLSTFDFPVRCVLLLGDAEVGHNAQSLSMADVVCHVEPSPTRWEERGTLGRGSLQPHVSGALAIWSYARSRLLAQRQG